MKRYLESMAGIFLAQLNVAICSNRAITQKNRPPQTSRSGFETTPESVTEYFVTLDCYPFAEFR